VSPTGDYQSTRRHAPIVQYLSNTQELTAIQGDAHHTITGRVWHQYRLALAQVETAGFAELYQR
jgi:hypothetical protein